MLQKLGRKKTEIVIIQEQAIPITMNKQLQISTMKR